MFDEVLYTYPNCQEALLFAENYCISKTTALRNNGLFVSLCVHPNKNGLIQGILQPLKVLVLFNKITLYGLN